MKNIINSIRSIYPVSDSSIELLTSSFTRHDLPKRHELIRGGTLDSNIYFIESGMTRSYCVIDGCDITTWFSKEGDITFGLLSAYRGEPGFEYVETIEPVECYSIPIERLNELYEQSIDIANWSRVIHQECLLGLQLHRVDSLSLPASERYRKLMDNHPDICLRANLGHIASFLGVTLSTLSKIRSGQY